MSADFRPGICHRVIGYEHFETGVPITPPKAGEMWTPGATPVHCGNSAPVRYHIHTWDVYDNPLIREAEACVEHAPEGGCLDGRAKPKRGYKPAEDLDSFPPLECEFAQPPA